MTAPIPALPAVYNGNGLTTDFAIPFDFDVSAHLRAAISDGTIETRMTAGAGFTVIGNAEAGFEARFTVAPPLGTKNVIVWREAPSVNTTKFTDLRRFPAETTEAAIDRLAEAGADAQAARGFAMQLAATDFGRFAPFPPIALAVAKFWTVVADTDPGSPYDFRIDFSPSVAAVEATAAIAQEIAQVAAISSEVVILAQPATVNNIATLAPIWQEIAVVGAPTNIAAILAINSDLALAGTSRIIAVATNILKPASEVLAVGVDLIQGANSKIAIVAAGIVNPASPLNVVGADLALGAGALTAIVAADLALGAASLIAQAPAKAAAAAASAVATAADAVATAADRVQTGTDVTISASIVAEVTRRFIQNDVGDGRFADDAAVAAFLAAKGIAQQINSWYVNSTDGQAHVVTAINPLASAIVQSATPGEKATLADIVAGFLTTALNFRAGLTSRKQAVKTHFLVLSDSLASQPIAPSEGDHYLLPAGPLTGTAWATFTPGRIAVFAEAAWNQLTPVEGWLADVASTGKLKRHDGAAWGETIATEAAITAAINALIAAAPGALDTLDELALALGDDANFATTVTNALATKVAGPASAVDNRVAVYDGATGKLVKDGGKTIAELAPQGVTFISNVGVLSTDIGQAAANRALLQQAIDTLKHVVVDQAGTFFFDATLTIVTLGQTFSGLGSNKTILTCTATSGPALRVKERSVAIRDIAINGTEARYNSVAPGMGIGIWLGPDNGVTNSMSHTVLERLIVKGHPKAGIALSAAVFQHSVIKDVLVQDCAGPGLVLDDGTYVGFAILADAPGIIQIDIFTAFHCGGEGLSVGTASAAKTPFRIQLNQLEMLYCGWKASERSADAQLYLRGTTLDLDNSAFADETGQITNLSGWARTAKTVVGRPYVIDRADHVIIRNPRQINTDAALWKTGSAGIICWMPRHLQSTAPTAAFTTEVENGVTKWFMQGRTQSGATNFIRALSADGRYVLDNKTYLPVANDDSDFMTDAGSFAARTITSGFLRVFQDKTTVSPEGGVADVLVNVVAGAVGILPPPAGAVLWLVNESGVTSTISSTLGNIRTYSGVDVEWKDKELIRLVSDGTVVRLQGQRVPTQVVIGPTSAVADRIAVFDGTTGKLVKDGGKTVAEIDASLAAKVAGPASAVANRIAAFDGTTGKLIKDSGKLLKTAYASQDAVEGFVVPADAHTIVFTTRTSATINTISGANMENGQVVDIFYRVTGLAALFQDDSVAAGNLQMRSNNSFSMTLMTTLTLKWDLTGGKWLELHRSSAGGSPVTDLTSSATVGTLPTPNGSVTIADAASPTNVELLEYCRELESKVNSALTAARTNGLIGS